MSDNLATILTDTAAERAEHVAFKLDDVELTYAMLDDGSARVARLLRAKGLEPGDRVGLMLPNVPYFPVGLLRDPARGLRGGADERAPEGARGALLPRGSGRAAASSRGTTSRKPPSPARRRPAPSACWSSPATSSSCWLRTSLIKSVEQRAADETAVILYTSGTTGKPKGAELTHGNLRRNCATVAGTLAGLSPDDVLLGALPLFHSFGQTCTMNASVSNGSTVTMLPRFDPAKALEIIARDRVTIFQGVPTMYNAMLHCETADGADCSTLRLCMSGGAAMPAELMRAFEEKFGCIILEGYGLSETSPVASFNHPDKERKPGSIGTPIEGVEMKLVDDDRNDVPQGEIGEIVIRGHNIMKGYWDRPEATAESISDDGWFHSGDMGKVDEDGYFFIVDRKKELIIRGGYNVYPREVEEVLYEHPAVQEAAVVGVPDEALGEEVGAAVVLCQGSQADAEELKTYVKEQVAAYKYPRKLWFLDELPKGPTGKILKREIEVPAEVTSA